jgi:hypothetical protein
MTDTGELVPLAGGWVFDRCISLALPSGPVHEARTKPRDVGDGLPTLLAATARTPDEAIALLQNACKVLADD